MESGLVAKTQQTVFQGDGGSYYTWSSAEFPILAETKLGGGVLILKPFGFALPHYADSDKIGFVTHGSGKAGMLLPGASEEKVVKLTKGMMIPVPLGATSWWFNDGSTEFTVIFLGDTSKANNPGNFTYFFLSGTMGVFNGFSTEFSARALGLPEEETKKIIKSQTGALIVKLKEGQHMPEPSKKGLENIIRCTEISSPNCNVKDGGRLVVVTSDELSLLKEVGLSGAVVKLHKNAMYAPEYSSDSAVQIIYIVKGSGRVQIVGLSGQNALDATVKAGALLVVPRFFVFSVIAGGEMEWFSIFTTEKPVLSQLAGRTSAWKAMSPQVVQAALDITPEIEESLITNMNKNGIFFPGPK